ncbi:MAG: ECF-type sigma factor [Gemmatimonadota bacterium]|nr:ECF-type sigma factor [Gemmatimonadota bacterium]
MSLEHLVPILYDELRDLARGHLAREAEGHTLDTTGLVHEAYLKLADSTGVGKRGRAYFFGAAARAMRQVLVEHARRRKATKRGGGDRAVTLDTQRARGEGSGEDIAADVLDLERALLSLESTHPRLVRVVECRFFAGMSVAETAEALEVSARTVKYDWALARARLYQALGDGEDDV